MTTNQNKNKFELIDGINHLEHKIALISYFFN